jgi:acetyl-CoA carboxylase carboxyltransferase component
VALINTSRDAESGVMPLSPRGRIELLVDSESVLEIAAQARSQQPSVAEATPGDGVLTVLARVRGRNIAVLAEDGSVLERTDGEVARSKRHRLFDLARMTDVPIVVMFDGPTMSPGRFDPNAGELAGHTSDPRLDVNLRARTAPLIGVICGELAGWANAVVGDCDVLIVPKSRVATIASMTSGSIVAADEASAIVMASSVLELLAPAKRHLVIGQPPPPPGWANENRDAGELASTVFDEGTYISFADHPNHLSTGIGRLGGWPVVGVVAGGSKPATLSAADLSHLRAAYALSRRYRLPLLTVENCAGIDGAGSLNYALIADLIAELRDSDALKVCLITGKGHVLGTFPLGSRQLGTDYFIAWPWASLSIVDPSTDYSEESLEAVREPDPWLAAGRGLIDDVLSPEESIESIRWLIDVYMSNRTDSRQEVSSA